MLSVRGLSVSYGMHRALAGVSLRVDPAEIVVILGANGAGKSSLLRAVAGLSEGTAEGEVALDGAPLLGLSPDAIVEAGVAFVPEGRGIFGDLTVAENLTLGAYTARARAKERENRERVFSLFPKLAERRGQVARTMSGGEQQMVAIGRALMSDPRVLMLDEPSLGLSPLLCKELFGALSHIAETGMGVLMVEQNARQSLAIADRGYLLEIGAITGQGAAADLLHDPAVQAAYLGGAASAAPAVKAAGGEDKAPAGPLPFVTPRRGVRETQRADAMLGLNVGDLVSKASSPRKSAPALSHPVPPRGDAGPRPTQPGLRPFGAENAPQERFSGAPHPPGGRDRAPPRPAAALGAERRSSNQERDPAVAKLLADFETAARNARTSAPPVAAQPQASREPDAPLPEIPVWKRATVEVWRRDASGRLVKQDRTP